MKNVFSITALFLVLTFGNPSQVKKQLPTGAIQAAQSGDTIALKKYLNDDSSLITATDTCGFTLLYISTAWYHVQASRLLLSLGADPYAVDNRGYSILFETMDASQYEMLKLFLDFGFNINYIDSTHENCAPLLCMAAKYSTSEMVSLLLQRGAKVNIRRFSDGNTPLHSCFSYTSSIKDRYHTITLLLDSGADPNAKNNDSQTPLFKAWDYEDTSVISLLVHHGADINAVDSLNGTPLIYAVLDRRIDVIKALIDNGADINLSSIPSSALSMAVGLGEFDIIKFLLENHAKVNKKSREGNTVLLRAVEKYYLNPRAYMADPDLLLQYKVEQKKIISLLLHYGADANASNNDGMTPLKFIQSKSDTEIVKLFKK